MIAPGTAFFGGAPARDAGAGDAVQGVRPAVVVQPDTPDGVAAVLREAAIAKASIVIRGGGTRMDWGRPPRPIDVLLDLSRLDRVIAHEHGDLTATVEGGATIAGVNAVLARHGQWMPIDHAFPGSTIGGTIATADSGPLRHRYGTARDQIIGVTLATTDGELVRAGGRVVKNVAGYDLGKLVSGSLGAFAAIVAATFKVFPAVRHAATLAAAFEDRQAAAVALRRVASSRLEPMSVEVHATWSASTGPGPACEVLLRFASTPRSVEAQVAQARALMAGVRHVELVGEAEAARWRDHVSVPWERPGAIARIAWPTAQLDGVLGRLADLSARESVAIELTGRAGVGAGTLRVEGDAAQQGRVLASLRTARPHLGAVVLLRGSGDLKAQFDVWGDVGSSLGTLQSLKRAFDPAEVLGAGRGVV